MNSKSEQVIPHSQIQHVCYEHTAKTTRICLLIQLLNADSITNHKIEYSFVNYQLGSNDQFSYQILIFLLDTNSVTN